MIRLLITTNHPAPYMDRWFYALEKKYTLSVIYYSNTNKLKSWSNYKPYQGTLYSSLDFKSIVNLIKGQDMIIVGGWTNIPSLMTIFLGKIHKCKVVVFTDYPFHQKKMADLFKRLILYRVIDGTFCATKSCCYFIEKKFNLANDFVKYFPYAIDFDNASSSDYELPEKSIDVLIANNFLPRKGYSVLFDAFRKIDSTKAQNINFHIAGHGKEFEKYKNIMETLNLNIKMYGWVQEEKYRELQRKCQVYIHASIEEPFGIPPVDAMALGKVVIISNGVKSLDSIMVTGYNGFIYDAYSSEMLAHIIENLRNVDFSLIGAHAMHDARFYFSIENNLTAIDEILYKDTN